MSDLQFANPEYVHFAWLIVFLLIWLYQKHIKNSNQLNAFVSPTMQPRLVTKVTKTSVYIHLLLFTCTLLLGVIALMRPQTPGGNENIATRRMTSDLMVVLDLSKSMLAEDAAPNRLNRAKSEIIEMVEQFSGHRVGLVGFAGKSSVLCPLTSDYGFFNLTLSNASLDLQWVSHSATLSTRPGIELIF